MEALRSLEVGKYPPGDIRLIPEDPTRHLSLLKGKVIPLQARCGPEGG